MVTVAQYTALAAAQDGTIEVPQNQVKYNTAFYGRVVNGKQFAWCQAGQWWVQAQLGMRMGIDCPDKTASVDNAVAWFKAKGRWSSKPFVGAQVCYALSGAGTDTDHTGYVVKVYSDGSWDAWEGNTDGAGGRTGGRWMLKHRTARSLGKVGGFGRLELTGTTAAAVPAPATPAGALMVDGDFGTKSIKRLQALLGVTQDGDFGPKSAAALQRRLGVKDDGDFGTISIKALQKRLGVTQDGDWGPATTRALQTALNAGRI